MAVLNVSVAAGAGDGYWRSGLSVFDSAGVTINLSVTDDRNFYYFPGVSGLSGVTINAASYFECFFRDDEAADIDIYLEKAAAPTAVTSAADGDGRSLTTATVTWSVSVSANNYDQTNSGDMTSLLQEIADSYDPSAIQVFLHAVSETFRIRSYDHGEPANLHIDYTATAAPGAIMTPNKGYW